MCEVKKYAIGDRVESYFQVQDYMRLVMFGQIATITRIRGEREKDYQQIQEYDTLIEQLKIVMPSSPPKAPLVSPTPPTSTHYNHRL